MCRTTPSEGAFVPRYKNGKWIFFMIYTSKVVMSYYKLLQALIVGEGFNNAEFKKLARNASPPST
jgi:hypothetical protein